MSFLSQATPLPKAKNVSLHVEASTVYLFCNLEKDFGESSSGKSILVASTSGNTPLGASNLLLGLNLFMKSRESRDVSPAVVEQLPKDFMECGESCAWRVEPRSQPSDPIVVCMRLNLGEAKEQAAASGKTILLASSKGNRKMGETGILFGLNCFRNEGKVVDLTKLVESASLQVGTTTEHSGNFRVDYTSPIKMRITHALTVPVDEANKANLRQEALVGEATVVVTISISPPKPKKRRVEPTTAAEGVAPTGGVVTASVSMKNVELACGGPADAPTLDITFNPSLTFGESASGKTIAVSTTSGAVDVSHPSDPSTAICRVNVNVWAEKVKTPVDAELVEHTVAAVLAEKKSEAMKMTLNELIQLLAERLKTNVDQISKYKTLIKAAVTATAK